MKTFKQFLHEDSSIEKKTDSNGVILMRNGSKWVPWYNIQNIQNIQKLGQKIKVWNRISKKIETGYLVKQYGVIIHNDNMKSASMYEKVGDVYEPVKDVNWFGVSMDGKHKHSPTGWM